MHILYNHFVFFFPPLSAFSLLEVSYLDLDPFCLVQAISLKSERSMYLHTSLHDNSEDIQGKSEWIMSFPAQKVVCVWAISLTLQFLHQDSLWNGKNPTACKVVTLKQWCQSIHDGTPVIGTECMSKYLDVNETPIPGL